ncbi:MAG: hypothetical protein WA892_00775 [Ornithinimicrobium sp.]
MQANVHTFDPSSGTGSVLRDDGTVLTFSAGAWSASGLRHLRLGQRVNIRIASAPYEIGEEATTGAGAEVSNLWITGIGTGQVIE